MRKLFVVCLALAIGAFMHSELYAQNYLYATGNVAFSTQIPIENGFINVNNGDIHIEIPLAQHPQRGKLQLNERLVYDSRIWKIVDNNGRSWQPTNVPNSMGGWRFTTGLEQGTISNKVLSHSATCVVQGHVLNQVVGYTYYGFVWTDPEGTAHPFSGQTYQSTTSDCATGSDQPTGSGAAVDGSGYSVKISNYVDMTVYDKSGDEVYPKVMDSSGNYWSQDSSGNLVDTLGRTPVLVSQSGNNIYYDVLTDNGGRARYTVTTQTVYYNTYFQESQVSESQGSFTAIQSIQLPDGSSYSFTYDSGTAPYFNYGEMTSVTLPTGGVIQYTYINFLDSFQNENRWIRTRVKDGGTTTFTPQTMSNCSSSAGCEEKENVTSPAGDDTIYTFTLDPGAVVNGNSWVTEIDAYQGHISGGKKLKSVNTAYTYTSVPAPVTGTYTTPSSMTSTTTLPDIGLTSMTKTSFDWTGSNPTAVQQWDYYAGSAPSTPTEQTSYTYGYGVNGASLPTQITTTDGAGNQISQTTYSYDQTAPVATSGLPNHTSVSGNRGNLTSTSEWLNTGGTLSTTATYDDAGTLLTSTSPNGTTTYGHDGDDAYVTSTTPPTPASGVSLASSASYDPSTGLISTSTDPNGVQTVYKSYDAFGRSTEIDYPDGGKTSILYRSPQDTSVYRYQTSSVAEDAETLSDTYGRASRAALANGQGTNPWYQQDTCYNANGEVSFKSYRYQGIGWGAPQVCSGAGDAYTYDALGRVTSVTHGDGTSIHYQYQGRATEVTDENGVSRISQVNALGQTTAVCEISSNANMPGSGAPTSCGTDLPGTGFVTSYSYDLANHRTTVTEGAQTRVFQTDSLGRTILVQEPESGTTTYSYAYNSTGLVVTRKRPRANQTNPSVLTTTTTQYDSVGRVVTINYDDGTPAKSYFYDQATNWGSVSLGDSKGRLTYESTQNDTGEQFAYDAMGRVINTIQCLPGWCGISSHDVWRWYGYDDLGELTDDQYYTGANAGSGILITTNYSYSPAGEITSINGGWNDASDAPNLIYNVQNGPDGPTTYQFGNGLSEARLYDSLGRLQGGWVCSGAPQVACNGQAYGFDVDWRGDRVLNSSDNVMGQGTTYGYDEFNRLTSTNFSSGAAYSYVYDRYGNRWQENTSGANVTFNTANNQISTSGYVYDAAGNAIGDGVFTYQYDAEGNEISVDNGQVASFTYDALNHRVQTTGANGSNPLRYAYNIFGQRASTWDGTTGNVINVKYYWGSTGMAIAYNADGHIHFEHQDWLGTERVRTSYNGQVEGTFSSLPFGDGYSANGMDDETEHFAGLDSDAAIGTDHAQFRQYSPTSGRWVSPDPYGGSYDPSNPQSFNRYSYVGNMPLSYSDPTGQDGGGGALACYTAAVQGGANPVSDVACGITALVDWSILDSFFGGGPSFHGSLKPRPNAQPWDENNVIYGPNIADALGLPDAGCDFGACGGGSSNAFPGGSAIAGTIACEFAEPCGVFEDIALLAGTAGVLGYDIYHMGRTQSNEWTDAAKQFAPQDPCGWLAQQLNKSENQDSATQRKIVQAQKFLGCRNVNKRNQ